MKHAKKILCALLAMAMIFAMSAVPAFADGETPEPTASPAPVDNTKLTITEKIESPAAALLPDMEFTANLAPATVADGTSTNGLPVKAGLTLGDAASAKMNISASTALTTEGEGDAAKNYAEASTTFDLSGLNFTTAGVYRYELTVTTSGEKADTYGNYIKESDGTAIVGTHKYQVDVYVTKDATADADGNATFSISTIVMNVMTSTTTGTGEEAKTTWSATSDKFDGNIIHILKVDTLKIVNHVYGEYSDSSDTDEFHFYINIPAGGDALNLEYGTKIPYIYKDQNGYEHTTNGKTNDEGETLYITVQGRPNEEVGEGEENDGDWYLEGTYNEFVLLPEESITLYNLPQGMIYNVVESDPDQDDDNTYSYKYVTLETSETDSQGTTTTKSRTVKAPTFSLNDAIVDGGNQVDFWNTRTPENTPTGITMDVLPYAMIAALAVAGGVLLISKKRKFDR
jgi:hypothetical protein